jgi:hypothetical protein
MIIAIASKNVPLAIMDAPLSANTEAKDLAARIVARVQDGTEKIPIRMSLINIDQRIIVELGEDE